MTASSILSSRHINADGKRSKKIQLIQATKNAKAGHVKPLVFRGRSIRIALTACLVTVLFGFWIFNFMSRKKPELWLEVAAPITAVGLLTIFLRPSREWTYDPWQSQAQQIEKTQYD